MSSPTEYPRFTHEQIASLKTIIKAATIEAVKEAVSEAFKQYLQPTPPKPITPSEPVIAPQPVVAPEQPVEPPPSIKKEKEKIVTSDTILDPATSADLCKLQTPRPSTGSAPTPTPTLKSSFSVNLMLYQQVTFTPSPAYISYTEEIEATG